MQPVEEQKLYILTDLVFKCSRGIFHYFKTGNFVRNHECHLQMNENVKLKQLGRYASLIHNIYIAADPTPVDVHHAPHSSHCVMRPQCLLSES